VLVLWPPSKASLKPKVAEVTREGVESAGLDLGLVVVRGGLAGAGVGAGVG
jgi:hypothetical protein